MPSINTIRVHVLCGSETGCTILFSEDLQNRTADKWRQDRKSIFNKLSRNFAGEGVLEPFWARSLSIFLRSDAFGATHGRPVVGVGNAADHADLIILSVCSDMWPGKVVGTEHLQYPVPDIACLDFALWCAESER